MIDFNLEIERLLKEANLKYGDIQNLSLNDYEKIESFFQSINYLHGFAEKVVYPMTISIISPSDKEKLLMSFFLRIYNLVLAILKLRKVKYFQTIASNTRILYELYLDLYILSCELIDNAINKFITFVRIQKYKLSKNIVQYYTKYKKDVIDYDKHKKFIEDNENEIKNTIINIWGKTKKGGPNFPLHWTGKNIRERAQLVDKQNRGNEMEELFVRIFYLFSLYVHSDPTGILGLAPEYYNHLIALSYAYVHKLYLKSIDLYCKSLYFNQSIPNYLVTIKNLENALDYFLIEKKLKGHISKVKYKKGC